MVVPFIVFLALCLTYVKTAITSLNELCHSSCSTCPVLNREQNGCLTCYSLYMNYLEEDNLTFTHLCTPDPNSDLYPNAELFEIIDKSTVYGSGGSVA